MPGVVNRDGTILTVPEFSQQQKDAMAEAIAKAMVRLSHDTIRKAVEEYTSKAG